MTSHVLNRWNSLTARITADGTGIVRAVKKAFKGDASSTGQTPGSGGFSPNGLKLSEEVAEDYLRLSGNILTLGSKEGIKTIAVASSKHEEGCSTVALNLASTLARNLSGNILLVDGNFRRPSLHNFFGLQKENGLSEIISGGIDIAGALKKSPIANLMLITSGNACMDPSQVYSSERFKEFVEAVGSDFEFVLFDSAPTSLYSDSTILSPLLDGVILVVQAERVIYEVVQKGKEQVEKNGGKILGVVLNRRRYYIPNMIYDRL